MNRFSLTVAMLVFTLIAPAQNISTTELSSMLQEAIKNALVVVRQDYQLIDDDEGEIKNSPGKEYWARTYSLGARIADNQFLLSSDAVRPWSKENLSKKDRFQPCVSYTAIRELQAPEFEQIDYSDDDVNEIVEKRLYTIEGSELTGMTIRGLNGQVKGFGVWVKPTSPLSEAADNQTFVYSITPMSLTIVDNRNIYDVPAAPSSDVFGGYFLVPTIIHPGAIDFCIAGQFMKISGVWKIVTVNDTTLLTPSTTAMAQPSILNETINGMSNSMDEFISQLGF